MSIKFTIKSDSERVLDVERTGRSLIVLGELYVSDVYIKTFLMKQLEGTRKYLNHWLQI